MMSGGVGAERMAAMLPEEVDVLQEEDLSPVCDALARENDEIKAFLAAEDAQACFNATKGMGTDESRLVQILCNRTKAQLDRTSEAMVRLHGKTLRAIVADDVSGSFGKLMCYALQDIDDYGACVFDVATKGVSADVNAIIDLVNTRTNAELAAIKRKWEAQNDKGLVDCLNQKFGMFSKHVCKVLVAQLLGDKSEGMVADAAAAAAQAQQLYKAGEGRMGTDEDTFIEILVGQSRAQIQAIKECYERAYGKSLRKAIEKEMSGYFEDVLVALLQPSPAAYTALALRKSLEGVGTDKDRLCRVLGGTDRRTMKEVCELYLDVYGTTLQESLNKEVTVTGDFLQAAIAWCNCEDPTRGLEYKTLPGDLRARARHLLAERDALRTHVAMADAQTIRKACKTDPLDLSPLSDALATAAASGSPLLPPPLQFSPGPNYKLSKDLRTAVKKSGSRWDAVVLGPQLQPGQSIEVQMTGGKTNNWMVGVAPPNINQSTENIFWTSGFYIGDGHRFSEGGIAWQETSGSNTFNTCSSCTAKVLLGADGTSVDIFINGLLCIAGGAAHTYDVPANRTPLRLAVLFCTTGIQAQLPS